MKSSVILECYRWLQTSNIQPPSFALSPCIPQFGSAQARSNAHKLDLAAHKLDLAAHKLDLAAHKFDPTLTSSVWQRTSLIWHSSEMIALSTRSS
jgi:hypothetical protein